MTSLLLTTCIFLAFIAHTKGNRYCQILVAVALLLFVIMSLGMMELDGLEEFCDEIVDLSEVYQKLEENKLELVIIDNGEGTEKERDTT